MADGQTKHGPIEHNLVQGSQEWIDARCGLLTASDMKLILTPTLKVASNEKERSHLYELLAQRITGFVEQSYQSDDMVRGQWDEIEARRLYAETYAPVREVGFITNDAWGFTLGYSPDGVVGDDGLIECKSRRQKHQVRAICEDVSTGVMDPDHVLQVQTGLLVAERRWCDFVSYCGGLPMVTVRVYPDEKIQAAIVDAATAFEERLAVNLARYRATLESHPRAIPTERLEGEIDL
ncbi:MAG: lambda exonuclease family protein [Alsobacter sp.]